MPLRNDGMDIQSLVIGDIVKRRIVGIERYGTPLQAHNGRDALRDAYEEALDLAMYLRQAIEERGDITDGLAGTIGGEMPPGRIAELEELARSMLASYTRTSDGYRARAGQVQIAKWTAILNGEQP